MALEARYQDGAVQVPDGLIVVRAGTAEQATGQFLRLSYAEKPNPDHSCAQQNGR
jgi:hypothetical protein